MKPSIKSILDPHKDVNINNTQKESEFRVFDFTPLWLGLGLWKHLISHPKVSVMMERS